MAILRVSWILLQVLSDAFEATYVQLNSEIAFNLCDEQRMQIETAMNLLHSYREAFKCVYNLHDHLLELN